MGMAVGNAGNDGPLVEIDDPRRRSSVDTHRFVRTDRKDTVARNGHCRGDGESRIDGDNSAVFENEIGRPDGGLRRGAWWPSEPGGYGSACGQQKITAADRIGVGGHGSL